MNTVNQLIPLGHPNRPGTKLEALKALVFHYTGNEFPGATDTMNAKYFGRAYVRAVDAKGKNIVLESDGKTPFRYGSTQIIADMDSVTMAIPTDEVSWAVGDQHVEPVTPWNQGQQPIARNIFNFRQNYQTINIEMCNNDAIKNSDEDWNLTVANASKWAIDFLKKNNLKVDLLASLNPQKALSLEPNTVLILRHYDISGKLCPKKFVDSSAEWTQLVERIAFAVNEDSGIKKKFRRLFERLRRKDI